MKSCGELTEQVGNWSAIDGNAITDSVCYALKYEFDNELCLISWLTISNFVSVKATTTPG